MRDLRHREAQVQHVLNDAGFVLLYLALEGAVNLTDHCITWDTTNTLHVPFREMTITPFDFVMPMGLGFSGDLLGYQEYLYL